MFYFKNNLNDLYFDEFNNSDSSDDDILSNLKSQKNSTNQISQTFQQEFKIFKKVNFTN